MTFEIFKETGIRSTEFISINETKAFGLSRAFLDAHGITRDQKAVIMYDQDSNKIALHFSQQDIKYGLSVRIGNEKHGAIIMAKSFFDRKKIDVGKYARRYHDFNKVTLNSIGINVDGDAFVIQLVENNSNSTVDLDKDFDEQRGGADRLPVDMFPGQSL